MGLRHAFARAHNRSVAALIVCYVFCSLARRRQDEDDARKRISPREQPGCSQPHWFRYVSAPMRLLQSCVAVVGAARSLATAAAPVHARSLAPVHGHCEGGALRTARASHFQIAGARLVNVTISAANCARYVCECWVCACAAFLQTAGPPGLPVAPPPPRL